VASNRVEEVSSRIVQSARPVQAPPRRTAGPPPDSGRPRRCVGRLRQPCRTPACPGRRVSRSLAAQRDGCSAAPRSVQRHGASFHRRPCRGRHLAAHRRVAARPGPRGRDRLELLGASSRSGACEFECEQCREAGAGDQCRIKKGLFRGGFQARSMTVPHRSYAGVHQAVHRCGSDERPGRRYRRRAMQALKAAGPAAPQTRRETPKTSARRNRCVARRTHPSQPQGPTSLPP